MSISIEAVIRPLAGLEVRACPRCGKGTRPVEVLRRYKLFLLIPVWSDRGLGYRCPECSGNFIAQGAFGLWADVVVMCFAALLITATTMLPTGVWVGVAIARAGGPELAEVAFSGGLFL